MSDDQLAEALHDLDARHASKEAYELLALVKPSGIALTHLASQDLKGYKKWICRAVDEGRKDFFIDLGKLLEGKRLKPNTWNR